MAGFGRPQREAKMSNQRTSRQPSSSLITIIFQQKPLMLKAIFVSHSMSNTSLK